MIEEIKQRCLALQDATIAERRYFHRYPELSFEEVETSRKIADTLRQIGFDRIRIGAGGKPTGVTADLHGGTEGETVALRADIDALPITEGNHDLAYRSQNKGVMHACGHDGHIASLLCAARVLFSLRDRFAGRVRFIFQPAEETPESSGAKAMIEDGVLDGVGAIFGVHVWSTYPTGTIGYAPGPITASSDLWSLVIRGKGGHAAMPHMVHDPVPAACQVVTGLQTIVSREIDPLASVVLSACRITAGEAFNVIADECTIVGTVRCLNPKLREQMPGKIERVAKGISSAMQCQAELEYLKGLPPTVNDPEMTRMAAGVAAELVGHGNTILSQPSLGAEDMSLYLQKVPGSYLLVGCRNPAQKVQSHHHHSEFDLDERALPLVAALLAGCAARFLGVA